MSSDSTNGLGASAAAGGARILSATPGSTLSPAQIAKTRKSAEDFEAMAIGQLLQPMFNTVDTSKGMFGGGTGEEMWKPMMVDEIGKIMAKNGGIGIGDQVFKEMLEMQEKKNG